MERFKLLALTVALIACGTLSAKDYTVKSPNGRVTAIVGDGEKLGLSILLDGQALMQPSAIGLTLADGTTIGTNAKLGSPRKTTVSDNGTAPFYRQQQVKTSANQLDFKLKNGFGLQVRAYDEGVSYRFYTTRKGETVIRQETVDFAFTEESKGWLAYTTNPEKPFAMAFQNTFHETMLVDARPLPAFLPVTIQPREDSPTKVTLLESDLRSYPGMFVKADGDKLSATFAPYPKKIDYYKWRGMSYVSETEDYIAKCRKITRGESAASEK